MLRDFSGSPINAVACLVRPLLSRMIWARCRMPSTTCDWSMTSVNSCAVR